MRFALALLAVALSASVAARAAQGAGQGDPVGPGLAPFVSVNEPSVAITRVRLVDGTGRPALPDATVVFAGGRIRAVGPSATTPVPANSRIIDGRGRTLLPGMVGTHSHLFTGWGEPVQLWRGTAVTFPRLYLAAGTTSLRTTGAVDVMADLKEKARIDAGTVPGPKMDLTAPFLTGPGNNQRQMIELRDAADAAASVKYWADRGITSFKLYEHISTDAMAGVIRAAHARSLKVLGHLCSVGFRAAAAAGIDELEHGILVDGDLVAGRQPGECIGRARQNEAVLATDMQGPEVGALIGELIRRGVAISSTLPVFESFGALPGSDASFAKTQDLQAPEVRDFVAAQRNRIRERGTQWAAVLRKEMEFELRFFRAGGLLVTGPDPSGYGAVIAGVGDWRCVELLAEAGLSPVEAIRVATLNGAKALGRDKEIGSIEVGKAADLILVRGDPTLRIADIENVETVFKDGVGYDSAKLFDSVRGVVSRY